MTDELKHIIQLIDDMRDNRVIEAAIRAHVQKAIDDEKQNPWKAAIIDELIVDCIYSKEHESDPRRALAEAIAWNVKVALDPSASKEARDMQQAAINAALESVANRIKLEVTTRGYDPDNLTMVYSSSDQVEIKASMADKCYHIIKEYISTNPLAEAQARIAELERERDRAIQHHERCAEKLFKAERELAETRKDAERWKCARIDPRVAAIYCQSSMAPAFKVDKAIDAAMRQEEE